MKLCYLPGSCALAPHIALHWIGVPFETYRVPREQLHGDYLKINPQGKVPALIEDDGGILTEAGAILQYLADKYPEAQLGPGPELKQRYAMNQWLSNLGGNVHPAFYPFFLPKRYHPDAGQHPVLKEAAQAVIFRQMELMDRELGGKHFVLEGRRTIVDPYLFALFRWNKNLPRPLEEYSNLFRFYQKMLEDAGVQRAMAEQGLEP
ncbi:MAG: glutathione S-transferase N-terminal domain-containing protein [bacterium]